MLSKIYIQLLFLFPFDCFSDLSYKFMIEKKN